MSITVEKTSKHDSYNPTRFARLFGVEARYLYPIILLAAIAGATYLTFYAPILYSDDWSLMIGRWYYGNLKWFDLTTLRPMLKARLVILYALFGLNIHAFYAVLWVLNVTNVIQLYFLILKFIPKHSSIAFSIAALTLVYPADFTHMWLTMIQIRTVVFLTLLYAHLLLKYAETQRTLNLIGALICLLISFGMHESQLGIAMFWCLLVIFLHRHKTSKNLYPLLSPLIIGALFVIWNRVGPSALGLDQNYRYVNDLVLTPTVILGRLIMGYQLLVWAWIEPLMLAFQLQTWQVIIILILATFAGAGSIYAFGKIVPAMRGVLLPYKAREDQLRLFMAMTLFGTVSIAAGYVPVIILFQPTLFPLGSRVNLFPSMGATIVLVSLITIVMLVISKHQTQINFMVVSAIVPLVILGSAVQLQVQYDNKLLWEEQKNMWREFFALIPDLQPETTVYFIFTNPEDGEPTLYRTKRPGPLHGTGDIGAAINILYGRRDLKADITNESLLENSGVKNFYNGKITPYDQTVFVIYNRALNQLKLAEDLPAEGLVDFSVPTYQPHKHIRETPALATKLRWLVDVVPQN